MKTLQKFAHIDANPVDETAAVLLEGKAALEKVSQENAHGSSAEPQPSIAVLPFANMSGDKEQE